MRARILATLFVAAMATACGDDTTGGPADMAAPAPDGAVDTRLERGTYLVNNVGLCAFCHTPLNADGSRDLTRAFSGVDCLFDIVPDSMDPNHQLGCISSANLTPDKDTGLGNWTDQQIINVWENGVDKDGKQISWVMPWWIFHNLTSDDKASIVAFLRSLPPVSHKAMDAQPPWNQFPPAVAIDDSEIPQPRAGFTGDMASAMRGRYLAAEAGLCVDCHTPDAPLPMGPAPDGGGTMSDMMTMMGDMTAPPPWKRPIDMTRPFAGSRVFTNDQLGLMNPPYPTMIYSANLTSDATGLAGWTLDDVLKAFTKGVAKDGTGVCAATHGNTISPYSGLTTQDATDIANYVLSLPPIMNMRPADCMGPAWP